MKANRTLFTWQGRVRSIGHAFDGIRAFLSTQHNALVHLAATAGVVLLCILFPVTAMEGILLVFAIAMVWAAELFNTSIEKIMDFISTERDDRIRYIKDVAAAAVLVTALAALIAGCIIFIPKISTCLQNRFF